MSYAHAPRALVMSQRRGVNPASSYVSSAAGCTARVRLLIEMTGAGDFRDFSPLLAAKENRAQPQTRSQISSGTGKQRHGKLTRRIGEEPRNGTRPARRYQGPAGWTKG